jgi:peptidoglycan/xylan/chitin deacetylase (PgdA/CDA1 family)
VLTFHRVAPPATAAALPDFILSPAVFAAELRRLARSGYRPVSEADLLRALYQGAPLPRRPVLLTFDDGYVDDVKTVLPLLELRGWPASFFVITGRVGLPEFLTWPQIQQLDLAGMDVGSHTVDHVALANLRPRARDRELRASREALEEHLGHPVDWFAYPYGSYDAATVRAVRRAGYLLAFTTDPRFELCAATPWSEPRLTVRGISPRLRFARLLLLARAARERRPPAVASTAAPAPGQPPEPAPPHCS